MPFSLPIYPKNVSFDQRKCINVHAALLQQSLSGFENIKRRTGGVHNTDIVVLIYWK